MSWLRLDDGTARNRKLAGLTAAQKWAWIELLLYCAGQRNGGRIPPLEELPRCVDAELLAELYGRELLDRDDQGGLHVHDWHIYNGGLTGAERTRNWRKRKRAEEGDVHNSAVHNWGGRRGEYGSGASSVTGSDVTTRALASPVTPKPLTPKTPVGAKAEGAADALDGERQAQERANPDGGSSWDDWLRLRDRGRP